MTTREDVRSFLDRLDLPVESVAEDMWVVRTAEGAELVVHYAPPVLVLRVRVMPLASGRHQGRRPQPDAAGIQRPRPGPRIIRHRR